METATKTIWKIDATHSEVQFKVKHLVISTVTGTFKKFAGSAETESEDFNPSNVNFSLDVDSIDTNVADRDAHLKSDDFFNEAQFPQIKFENGELKKEAGDNYSLVGDLTIRDNTKRVSLKAELGGVAVDPYGQTKAGFEVSGTISRKEFGLKWNAVTEAGGVVVGDEVKIIINAQLIKS